MLRLPAEWISRDPYYTHTWMDAVSVYYSMVPWPWLCLPFLLFVFPPILARDLRGIIGFTTLLAIERVFGVTIAGCLLILGACAWSFSVFGRKQVSRSVRWATGVALLVLAVAVLFGFPRVASFSPAVCRSNLKNVDTAIQMYQTDWSGALPPSLVSLTPNYLKTLPSCPADTAAENSLAWTVESGRYILTCENPFHKSSSATKVEPLVVPLTQPR